jgi:hypothetical protein
MSTDTHPIEIKLATGERSPWKDDDTFDMGSQPPEQGGDTHCMNPGCDACC